GKRRKRTSELMEHSVVERTRRVKKGERFHCKPAAEGSARHLEHGALADSGIPGDEQYWRLVSCDAFGESSTAVRHVTSMAGAKPSEDLFLQRTPSRRESGLCGDRLGGGVKLIASDVGVAADGREIGVAKVLSDEAGVACRL